MVWQAFIEWMVIHFDVCFENLFFWTVAFMYVFETWKIPSIAFWLSCCLCTPRCAQRPTFNVKYLVDTLVNDNCNYSKFIPVLFHFNFFLIFLGGGERGSGRLKLLYFAKPQMSGPGMMFSEAWLGSLLSLSLSDLMEIYFSRISELCKIIFFKIKRSIFFSFVS